MVINHTRCSDNLMTSRQLNEEKQEVSLKDDSLPGIVMEREELSDSEDDIGESVQFEYEEMGDSDGDYSDFEQQSNMLDKEENSIEFEKEEIISEDDETEEECRLGVTVLRGTAGASEDTLSVSAAASVSTRQNLVRKKSKKLKSWDSTADSLDIKSTKKNQRCKQGMDKHHGKTVQIGSGRRRTEDSEENSDLHNRNLHSVNAQQFDLNAAELPREVSSVQSPVKCLQKYKNVKHTGQMALIIDAGIDGNSSAFENEIVPKMHANGSGLVSEIAAQRNEPCVFDNESSTHQCTRDKTAHEAAQVLTGIHHNTADNKNRSQAS